MTATPSYTWTFPNGDTATGPGDPYTPDINPLRDPDHYVHTAHAHLIATPGE